MRESARRPWPMLGLLVLAWLSTACASWTDPFDYAINIGTYSHDPALKAPEDGVRRLVVLRHGLFRTATALWKLERALWDHGYEVFNTSYDSTSGYIEDHAQQLQRELQAYLEAHTDDRPLQLFFLGHSMGGVQLRRYFALPDALQPDLVLLLGTPQRGSALLGKRKDWWLFKLLMGHEGALQLELGHPLYDSLAPPPGLFGVLYGGYGDGVGRNDDVPGDDDGTVAVDEAQLAGAVDSIRLPLGHLWLTIDDTALRQVLYFLRHRRFDHF